MFSFSLYKYFAVICVYINIRRSKLVVFVFIVKLSEMAAAKEKFREKLFVPRDSLLTDLLNNVHIRTIYCMGVALMISLMVSTFFHDYTKHNRLNFGQRLIVVGFGNFHYALLLWALLFSVICLVYLCFKFWSNSRKVFSKSTKLYDCFFLMLLISFYVVSYYFVIKSMVDLDLESCSSVFLAVEHSRLLMKTHAFIRTNIPKVLQNSNDKENVYSLPKFSKYFYFLFVPTLIYRDEYPRTPEVRWGVVLKNFGEFLFGILYLSLLTERFIMPVFEDFCVRNYSTIDICYYIFTSALAGMFFILLVFYIFLHAFQNAFAEMLRFADRMFYKDWWSSVTWAQYYRTWNIIVHDWLYTFVYKDFSEMVIESPVISRYVVFFVSAFVHEVIMTAILRLFCPIMFVQFFCIGSTLYYVSFPKHFLSNVLFLYFLAFGVGIQLSLYSIEFFARNNFPLDSNGLSFFTPRALICSSIN